MRLSDCKPGELYLIKLPGGKPWVGKLETISPDGIVTARHVSGRPVKTFHASWIQRKAVAGDKRRVKP